MNRRPHVIVFAPHSPDDCHMSETLPDKEAKEPGALVSMHRGRAKGHLWVVLEVFGMEDG